MNIVYLKRLFVKIHHQYIKTRIKKNESVFSHNGYELKYYFEKCLSSNDLLVVFSGFPGKGRPAAYNMVSTFNSLRINKLFILDNFGYQHAGSYYLGESGSFFVRDLVLELLKEFDFAHTIFCGSSKGGYAALYFGLLKEADIILAGAPQYYIGNYLVSQKDHIPILDSIAGGHSLDEVDKYNRLLPDIISSMNSVSKTKIFLHYSEQEHTYPLHIRPLLDDLVRFDYNVECDIESYTQHDEVSMYFPQFCKREIISIIKKWN